MSTQTKPSPSESIAVDIETSDLLFRLRDLQAKLDAVKPLYTESDALILELARRNFTTLTLPDGTACTLVDNFVDKDGAPKLTSWKSCGIKRFDIDFTDEATRMRKANRKGDKS